MNYRLLSRVFAILLFLLAVAMSSCLAFAIFTGELSKRPDAVYSLAGSIIINAVVGLVLLIVWGRHSTHQILRKDAIAIVGLGWIICSVFGALPYIFCKPGISLIPAVFEAASGFTTTGATVITDLDLYPKSILLWRSVTQWLGGMGILVLFVALLSYLGVGSKALFHHESSAKTAGGLQARIHDVAVRIWQIYMFLTLVCTVGLVALGMTWYDAVSHTFTALSTGGFSPHNESVAFFNSVWIELWLVVFMILGSLSFVLFGWLVRENPQPFRLTLTALGTAVMIEGVVVPLGAWTPFVTFLGLGIIILAWSIRGKWQHLRIDEESQVFIGIIAAATLTVTMDLMMSKPFHASTAFGELLKDLRDTLFAVVSIITTTGFGTEDFNRWPAFSRLIILLLMCIGGCAGSTAGGVKVSRWLLFVKIVRLEITAAFRPNQVIALRLNGTPADERLRTQTLFFIALAGVTVVVGTGFVSLVEANLSIETALSSVLATLFNIGPGLGEVGPKANFAGLTWASQGVLTLMMLLGRLEFFAILVLFSPTLWKKY